VLKLDMRILAIEESHNGRGGSILSSIVRMAHWISLPVIAEGVETKEQANYLQSLGCYMMQGYYFAKPLPLDEFEALLKDAKTNGTALRGYRSDDILNAAEFLNTSGATSFLFSNCIGGGCLIEFEGTSLEALLINDQFYEEMGISREACDVKRDNMIELFLPEDRHIVAAGLEESVRKKTSAFYARPARDDHARRWVRSSNHYLASRNGKHMIFSLIEDVTESYLSEEKVAEANDRFKGFEALMSGGFYRYDIDSGEENFDFVSDGLVRMLEYPREDLTARSRSSLTLSIFQEDRTKILQATRGGQDADNLRYLYFRAETASGRLIHVRVERRIMADRHGRRWCYGHVIEQDGNAMNESRRRWQFVESVITAMSQVILFDYDVAYDEMVYCASEEREVSREIVLSDYLAQGKYESIRPEDQEEWVALFKSLLTQPTSGSIEVKGKFFQEEYRWSRIHYVSLERGNGAVYRIIGRVDDIEDEKQLMEQADQGSLNGFSIQQS